MIDVHNHLQHPKFDGRRDDIIATMQDAGLTHCVVNGTCEGDWLKVATLAERHPDFVIPSFGLHPWETAKRKAQWESQLVSWLERFPHAVIGECGLDRWMPQHDLNDQRAVFRFHLQLQRPVTIHCLKAWGPLLDELRACLSLPPFLLHSFGGSREVAAKLTALGAHFSFSGYFLQPQKEQVRDVFRNLPEECIFLETDAPDMRPPPNFLNHSPSDYVHPADLVGITRGFQELVKPIDQNSLLQRAEDLFLNWQGKEH